jgi:transmembrane sensor
MSTVRQMPDRGKAEEEASAWIARLHADDVTQEDRSRFAAWRDSDPAKARAYEQLAATWAELTNAGPWVRAVSFAQSMNEVAIVPNRSRRFSKPRTASALGVAAVALLAMVGAFFLTPWADGTDRYATAVGEHATIALTDGSTLELNSGSAASVAFSKSARVIYLKRGEGYFRVAHDTTRPFWVMADGTWVRAVGTEFYVYLRPDAVQVTVTDGAVKVGSSDPLQSVPSERALATSSAAILKAGEQADVGRSATNTRLLTEAERQHTESWREGMLYFDNQPLGNVAAELNRYTTVRVLINDESLRKLPVGGSFEATPTGLESFLKMLEQGFGLRVRREGGQVIVEKPDHS